MRILAVDPGSKRHGIAISDPGGTIAGPLTVIKHVSRQADAAEIARLAETQGAGRILVGQALDEEGLPTFEGQRAARLADTIQSITALPVELWDESFSTQEAQAARRAAGASRRRRRGHQD
ncbi:MAG TPA: Holliday junction resolvase RuvX, partial [Anaerolineales bacterium]|nr:Holliday junction resolvase RuvX [Anaerolineales bacterium]